MRCNCGIDPRYLSDEHLFAESRELKMLPSLYKRVEDKSRSKVPSKFTLGKGHMLFFLYKSGYTLDRYDKVFNECVKRGFNVKFEADRWTVYKGKCEEWEEDGSEKYIIAARIIEKIKLSPKKYFHYYHKRITKQEAIDLLIKHIN